MANSKSFLEIGTVLNNGEYKYRIEDVLGDGGFGITYLAIGEVKVGNVTTEAKFAIKEHFPNSFCTRQGQTVIPKDDKSSDYEKSKTDFISEAKKLHALGTQNENIVKVNEVFEENQTAYYVMQYIKGVSLAGYVKSKKKLTYEETLSLVQPIMDAVAFLHKSRINHLDIKPDNIMLDGGNKGKEPVLIDFGLSVHFKKNGDKTSPKGFIGVSEGYSPLEQYAGINEFNPATDIYAIAATMVYALTGTAPKKASELKLSDVRNQLTKYNVPQQAIDALCKALNKSDEDRTASVSAFKADLGIVESGGNDTVPISIDDEKWKRILRIVITAIVTIAIIVLLVWRPIQELVNKPDDPVDSDTIVHTDTIHAQPDAPVVIPPKPDSTIIVQTDTQTSNQQGDLVVAPPKPTPTVITPSQPVTTTGTLSLGYATWRGGIKNGKPDGKGRMSFTTTHVVDRRSPVKAHSGYYFDATYENGILISGKLYDSDGNLIDTIIP